jgi:translation initiation factor IF-3
VKEKKRILNKDIRARQIKLITDDGENHGEMHINDARIKAESLGLDLMEMWKAGELTIVKMLDYWKFLYAQKKQEQKNKQKWKAPDLKTIRITYKIWDHDLEIRKKQAFKFGEALHPLKVTLMLRGRENHYWELASEKMTNFVKSLDELYKLEGQIKRSGNTFSAMLKPIK